MLDQLITVITLVISETATMAASGITGIIQEVNDLSQHPQHWHHQIHHSFIIYSACTMTNSDHICRYYTQISPNLWQHICAMDRSGIGVKRHSSGSILYMLEFPFMFHYLYSSMPEVHV